MAIRLQGLAAPEAGEPGGAEATAAMRAMVVGRQLRCEMTGERTNDRCVGSCHSGPKDIAAELVRAGLARDCPRFSRGRYARGGAPGGCGRGDDRLDVPAAWVLLREVSKAGYLAGLSMRASPKLCPLPVASFFRSQNNPASQVLPDEEPLCLHQLPACRQQSSVFPLGQLGFADSEELGRGFAR
jgi:hypothetical protein